MKHGKLILSVVTVLFAVAALTLVVKTYSNARAATTETRIIYLTQEEVNGLLFYDSSIDPSVVLSAQKTLPQVSCTAYNFGELKVKHDGMFTCTAADAWHACLRVVDGRCVVAAFRGREPSGISYQVCRDNNWDLFICSNVVHPKGSK